MKQRTFPSRLTTLVVVGLSVSILVANLAYAGNDAAPVNPTAEQTSVNTTPDNPQQQQAGILSQAHQSLSKALDSLKQGANTDARQSINDALDFLHKAEQSTDKTVQEAATALLAESKAVGDDISSVNYANYTSQVEKLGAHAEAWAERAMDYSNTRWTDMSHYSPLTIDLIEARFHLQNAVIDQTTGHEPGAAKTELTEVQRAFDKAMQEADQYWTDPLYKQQITDMQTRIGKLLKSPRDIPTAVKDGQLGNIRQELQMIINSL